MDKFGPYLVYSLKSLDDISLCRVAVGAIGDLARALDDQMSSYLNELMPVLMDILRSSQLDRGVKLFIITVLGDLAISTGKFFFTYLRDVFEMLKSAAQVSVQDTNVNKTLILINL
jgi:importin subunit beta-1